MPTLKVAAAAEKCSTAAGISSVRKTTWLIFVIQKLVWVNSRASQTKKNRLEHKKPLDFY